MALPLSWSNARNSSDTPPRSTTARCVVAFRAAIFHIAKHPSAATYISPPPPLAFLPSQSAGLYASDISNIWGLEAEEAEDPEREVDASSARNGELHACATCRI